MGIMGYSLFLWVIPGYYEILSHPCILVKVVLVGKGLHCSTICTLRSLRYHILSPILNEGNLYLLSRGYNINCFPTAFPPKLVGDIRIF